LKRWSVIQPGWRQGDAVEQLLEREWLVTNGLGGYATGTIAGAATRRYHGKLVAALATPHGRSVMLNHLDEVLHFGGRALRLTSQERKHEELTFAQEGFLREFRLEEGLPVWFFENEQVSLEKRVVMPHGQNTTIIIYRIGKTSQSATLELTPSVHFRHHEEVVSDEVNGHYSIEPHERGWEIRSDEGLPPLRLAIAGSEGKLIADERSRTGWIYRLEENRGYESEGSLWSPGHLRADLAAGRSVALIASTESWDALTALTPDECISLELQRRESLLSRAGEVIDSPFAAQLALAGDQFVITPSSRTADMTRFQAAGDQPHTIIAGYHWFSDWGRDTMISLEGLTLTTRRFREAASILRTFASYIRDGLIPNLFPEREQEGLYHTVDATLWFFHAIHRYCEATGDRQMVRKLLPRLIEIIDFHERGTRFGIGIDPADGLLRQGEEGYQLTWMDAKVGDWVVTPRRGKAVEINALFYNALRLAGSWCSQEGEAEQAKRMARLADRLRESFNSRFWYDEGGYLFDVVDGEQGDDAALRPNQILSISLDHPVLDRSRWQRIVEVVERELVTPVGLRSLARGHPEYKPRYDGDLRARDAAYHQGTVWAWLIGPFIEAWLKTHSDRAAARAFLTGFEHHLGEACIGSISEVFDAEEPFTPRGCAAQAWSVAEALRCHVLLREAVARETPRESEAPAPARMVGREIRVIRHETGKGSDTVLAFYIFDLQSSAGNWERLTAEIKASTGASYADSDLEISLPVNYEGPALDFIRYRETVEREYRRHLAAADGGRRVELIDTTFDCGHDHEL
jgi:predicted glycogen debranching enzyme